MRIFDVRIGKIILLILYNISFVVCEVECDDDHKCQEGSKCVKITLGQNSYNLCVCAPGFTGWDCSTPIDYCNKHCRPLQTGVSCKHTLCNQGQCINLEESPYYRCDCGAFYKGENCEIEDNPCSYQRNNPCGNGDCEFVPGIYQINCKCHPGWTTTPNQINTKYTWNGVDVHMTPPCLEELKKGITGSAPILGPNAKVAWYVVLIVSCILFVWFTATTLYELLGKKKDST
ncbi:putative integral membrane protein [Theileria parva strain Muguga]|uniref:putative integral membrane protein n=1 Tax=Theileria parva strain Muguga TaxID=333668 RepID=UPI001C61E2BA|nr:putative integral membrane protein [Theileria parva strain Muguga]KAF5153515.1 putative integral membrane protein [Theileria parva strain Muguga]